MKIGRGEWIRTTDLLVPEPSSGRFAGVCIGLLAFRISPFAAAIPMAWSDFRFASVCAGMHVFNARRWQEIGNVCGADPKPLDGLVA
jgi:hypothetical protein